MSMEQVNGTARQAVIEAACRNKKDYEPDQVIDLLKEEQSVYGQRDAPVHLIIYFIHAVIKPQEWEVMWDELPLVAGYIEHIELVRTTLLAKHAWIVNLDEQVRKHYQLALISLSRLIVLRQFLQIPIDEAKCITVVDKYFPTENLNDRFADKGIRKVFRAQRKPMIELLAKGLERATEEQQKGFIREVKRLEKQVSWKTIYRTITNYTDGAQQHIDQLNKAAIEAGSSSTR